MIGIMQGRLTPSLDGRLQFFPFENWQREFALAKKIGFDAIEWLVVAEKIEKNPLLSENEIKEINKLKKTCGIRINSICADYFCEFGFSGKNKQLSRAILKLLIQQASKIGAKQIIIPFLGKTIITSENREEISEQIALLLIAARDFDIKLALETSLPARELISFIAEFRSDYASICYDVGNCAAFGFDAPEEIKMLGDLISEVHIKDRKKNNGPNMPLGAGDTPFEDIFAALKSIRYSGPFVLETPRVPGKYAEGAGEYMNFIKNLTNRRKS